ncbi:MAG TPA: hypothetical protein VFT74_01375 [Isosphaeraceae bacterium]|nr:hypothetical protein [Isosphaeraceae bacterium]
MSKWLKKTVPLKADRGWECREGYKIFVADRGAVRFDIPSPWVIEPGKDGSVRLMDAAPPDDEWTLEMTISDLNDEADWSGLSLPGLLGDVTAGSGQGESVLEQGEVVECGRDGMEAAWRETGFLEQTQKREAVSRTLLVRWSNIQPIFTFSFWKDDEDRQREPWEEFVRTLNLGDYVEDPTQRVVD